MACLKLCYNVDCACTMELMITVKQAAERLGLNPMTVRLMMQRHLIEYYKIGRAVRIPASEIERILNQCRIARTA
jgi:excisionase family DNA binding protein